MTTDEMAPTEREEMEMLLPWYVTGKLDASDRERVATYLKSHPAMALQLDLVRDEMHETITANEATALPPARGVEDLVARVAAEKPQPGVLSTLWSNVLAGISEFFSTPSANAVRWAAAAAVVVVLTQAVTIGALVTNRGEPGSYQTASGGSDKRALDGAFALVRFAPGASANDVAAALGELKMTIADGPSAGGFFVVRIGDTSLGDAERADLMAGMRKKSHVFMLVTPTR